MRARAAVGLSADPYFTMTEDADSRFTVSQFSMFER
jgi:hypothetical protein